MLQQAAGVARDGMPSAAGSTANSSLLLSESQQSIGGPPPLMEKLTPREREIVLKQGRRKVLNRGQTLFNQGAKHDGIYLIESGRIRVFYTSPLGREITLAYWRAGNFVGGPEVFGGGIHQWSGIASSNSCFVQLPGKELRTLATEIPNLAIGLIEGLTFKGKCYSALAPKSSTKSMSGQVEQIALGVDSAIVAIREGDVQPVAEIAHLDDRNARKPARKALVEPCADAMRAFAGQAQFLRGQGDAAARRCRHRK